jgi:hypothetical protein
MEAVLTPILDTVDSGTILNIGTINAGTINIGNLEASINVSGNLGKTTIYEAIGTGTIVGTEDSMSATSGSLIIKHGNVGGGSSIVFPNANSVNDYGYIRYRDDKNNGSGINDRGRLEIGIENDFGTSTGNDNECLVLNKNGGFIGVGHINPTVTLDVSGNGRFTGETIIGGNLGIGTTDPAYTLDVSGTARITGATTIYEAIGTGTITGTIDSMSATSGSLIIQHGNVGGGSSIVFPNANSVNDYGYIRYRDDKNNGTGINNRGRLEIGIENEFGPSSGNVNECLVLNKNGGFIGVGHINPSVTLDVSGNGQFTGTMLCNNYDKRIIGADILIGSSVTTETIAIGNGIGQNGLITIGGSGNSARTITIGSAGTATATSPINLNGNVTLNRPLTLPTTYVAPTSGQLGYIITRSFTANTTLTSGSWVSSPSFTIPPGHYILNTNIRPKPGNISGAIFTGAYISVTSGTLNTGTSYYFVYDSTTKPNLSFGNTPYLAMYLYSAVFTCTTSLTVYLNFQGLYSVSGNNQAPALDTTDSVYLMRIA